MQINEFQTLLEEHRNRIYSYTLYCLRDPEDAEDLTQEVFLRLWRHRAEIDGDKAQAWLIRVAHNLCIDHARRRKTVRTYLGRPDREILDRIPEPGGPQAGPEADLQRSRLRQEVLEAMSTLQDETRSIMLMHYFQGLKLQEIAQALGKKTSTVKVQVHRARKTLRLVLEAGREYPLASQRETG